MYKVNSSHTIVVNFLVFLSYVYFDLPSWSVKSLTEVSGSRSQLYVPTWFLNHAS